VWSLAALAAFEAQNKVKGDLKEGEEGKKSSKLVALALAPTREIAVQNAR